MLWRYMKQFLSVTSIMATMILVLTGCNQDGGGLAGAAGGSFGNLTTGRASPYAVTYTFSNNVYVSTNASGVFGYITNPGTGTTCAASLSLSSNGANAKASPGVPLNEIYVVPGDTCDLFIKTITLTKESTGHAIGGKNTGNAEIPEGGYSADTAVNFGTGLSANPTTQYKFNNKYIYVNAKVTRNTATWLGYGPLNNPMTVDIYVGDNLSSVNAGINNSYGSTAITGIASASAIPPPTFCVASATEGTKCDTTGTAGIVNVTRSAQNYVITQNLAVKFFESNVQTSGIISISTANNVCSMTSCGAEEFKIVSSNGSTAFAPTCGTNTTKGVVSTTFCTFAQIDTLWNGLGSGTTFTPSEGVLGVNTFTQLAGSTAPMSIKPGLSLTYNAAASPKVGTYTTGASNSLVTTNLTKDFLTGIDNTQSSPIAIPACANNTGNQVRMLILKHTDTTSTGFNAGANPTNLPSYTVIGFPFCY